MEALLSQQDWPAHGHPVDEQHHITEMPYRPYPPPHRPEAPLLYKARYNLPADLDSIYFLNRGAGAMGSVRYELAPKDSENITIYVDMHYWSKAALGQVNMCVLHRGELHKGFGIFTPSSISWPLFRGDRRAIKFDVVVRIPQSALISPLSGLASDLHDFSQFVDGLKHYWSNVNLTSTNGAIVVKSEARLQAANLTLHTTNARIEGSFFSDHVLKMTTTNAPIVAEVGLSSQGYPTTTANIRTNNARINASFYLSGAYTDDETYPGSGGNFNINAWSWGGPIDLAIPIAPINYHLRLFSHTNNAANKARIFRTFEGLFRASTRNAQVKVSKEVTAGDDPQREERHPTLEISDRRKGFSHGKFFWGETYHSRASEFELMTDNGPVEITFI
ncbi:hypothetical protein DL93DRAFT_1736535 [Clavulina sp. PMI_390]|nr:hypothetical protein DL93DRAFT_1736535 [Clavulina sp. PMI_390]